MVYTLHSFFHYAVWLSSTLFFNHSLNLFFLFSPFSAIFFSLSLLFSPHVSLGFTISHPSLLLISQPPLCRIQTDNTKVPAEFSNSWHVSGLEWGNASFLSLVQTHFKTEAPWVMGENSHTEHCNNMKLIFSFATCVSSFPIDKMIETSLIFTSMFVA